MTIGVPVCRDTEACGVVAARLARQNAPAEAIVVLDEDGIACGWLTRDQLCQPDAARLVGEVMDEDIPSVPPTIPLEAALEIMHDRGVEFLFLMHDWPGERRPSAVVSLKAIEQRMRNG
jgi:CBS domain-containing protein